ncbi:MAG: carboxyl transferase domain-containing protein, partial [Marinomonas sp.]
MTWAKELEELRTREELAEKMGGEDKLARQHKRGKMDARARLDAICDDGSFREIGKIAGKGEYDANGDLISVLPAPFLFGKATINGRPVVATADDFTIRGGAADAGIKRKMVQAEMMAHQMKLPMIRMIDGTGGGGSVKTLEQIGATYIPAVPGWGDVVTNLDTVPVVALALGPTAGLGAARTVASHYSIMVRGLSQLFAAGPAVVDAMGEDYEGSKDPQAAKEDLGGVDIHTRNGVVDDEVASEAEAFARARHFLSFMPEHVGDYARRAQPTDPVDRREEDLLSLVPRDDKQVYSMRRA